MSGTKEIDFEDSIFDHLKASRLYAERSTKDLDLEQQLDLHQLEQFLKETQPESFVRLSKQFPGKEIQAVANELNQLKNKRGLLNLLREGFTLQGAKIKLVYFKPSSDDNPDHLQKYQANRFSIMRQVIYNPALTNEIDLAITLNGIPIISMELKNEFTGQNITHAIHQYEKDRDPRDPFLKHCLVHFAVDNNTVFFTSKLNKTNTMFFPFNRDTKNPQIEGSFASSYLWKDFPDEEGQIQSGILQADSLLELIQNYIQLFDKKEWSKGWIFPRFHQVMAVRKLIKHARENSTGHNYLVQHSAGSGKSFSISWLSHQLANLTSNGNPVFDSVIVITDRKVLDKQLQKDIAQFEKINGTVRKIDKNTRQLLKALQDGDKIIISTLQKFGWLKEITEGDEKLAGKKFAIIVDEAHSSQSGESIKDLKMHLTSESALQAIIDEDDENGEPTDEIEDELKKIMVSRQKLPHLSFFAFTATPKDKTLQLFGIPDPTKPGGFRAFHTYTMRQAIEEGFIEDVLKYYTTKKTYFELLEGAEFGEEEFEKLKAKKLLLREVNKHPYSINLKSQMMIDHFMTSTIHKMRGKAKAMVVTSSRAHAVLYKQSFDKILVEQYAGKVKALVAFSGKVYMPGEDDPYTEEGMNPKIKNQHIKDIADAFNGDDFKFLIVANKYQTGFDQPLLHTMYVDKKLGGVNAVQTLSRLNRRHDDKKDTFVLDFFNSHETIEKSFQPYYQSTTLSEGADAQKLYNLKYEIEEHKVFTPDDIEIFIELFVKKKVKSDNLSFFFRRIVDTGYLALPDDDRELFRKQVNKYVRLYSFLSQVITFIDTDLEKFYLFSKLLYKYLPYEKQTLPEEVIEMVDLDKYRIRELENGSIILKKEDAEVTFSGGDGHGGVNEPEVDYLSAIVKEINDKYAVDLSEADKVVRDVQASLLKNEALRSSMMNPNNSAQAKMEKLKQSIDAAHLSNVESHLDFMTMSEKNPGFQKFFMSQMYQWLGRQLNQ